MLFSTGKRTVVCDRLGQELQGNFCSHGQSLSIEPLSPRSDGDRRGSRHPLHPAAPLPTEGARQALRCVSGGGLSLIQRTKVLVGLSITCWKSCLMPLSMLNCPLGCQQQPLVLGVGLGCSRGALGMDPAAAFGSREEDGCRCLMGCFLGYYLFKKMFLHCSVLN